MLCSPSSPAFASSPTNASPPDIFERARFDDRTRFAGDNTVVQSVLILCNVIIAMGVLNMPFTFRSQGYFNFCIAFFAAALMVRTSQLVHRAVELAEPIATMNAVAPKFRDWAYLAGLASGDRGSLAARFVLLSSLTSYIVAFLSALGVLINGLAPICSVPVGIAIATFVAWTLTRLPMKVLGQLALAAHASFLVAFICLLMTGFGNFLRTGGPSVSGLLQQRAQELKPAWSRFSNIPSVFYLFVFSMAGTSVLPSILANMKERDRFEKVLFTSYLIAVSVYIFVGLSGFLLFGTHTAQLFTSNLGTDISTGSDLPNWEFLRPLASLTIICKLELCIPVLAYPLFSDVKKTLARRPSTRGLVSCRWHISRYFWRLPFLAAMGLCAALFGDQVVVAVSVVGALFGTPLVFYMPVLVFVGLSRKMGNIIGFWKWLELIVILLVGTCLGCFAIKESCQQLFKSMH